MKNFSLKNLAILGMYGVFSFAVEGGFFFHNKSFPYSVKHHNHIRDEIPISEKKRGELLEGINPGLKEYAKKIYVLPKDKFDLEVIAHTIFNPKNKTLEMCIPDSCAYNILLHELAHVRHASLDSRGSEFSNKWKKISNFNYGEENLKQLRVGGYVIHSTWKDGTDGPKDGVLSPYGAESMREDIATFVESLGYALTPEQIGKLMDNQSGESFYFVCYPLYIADTSDERYRKKLDLLKRYGFFSDKEHKTLTERLGCLRHLLREKNDSN